MNINTDFHTKSQIKNLNLFFSDYVGFIKKIIKLMQNKYHKLKILEVELRQEGNSSPPPGKIFIFYYYLIYFVVL